MNIGCWHVKFCMELDYKDTNKFCVKHFYMLTVTYMARMQNL